MKSSVKLLGVVAILVCVPLLVQAQTVTQQGPVAPGSAPTAPVAGAPYAQPQGAGYPNNGAQHWAQHQYPQQNNPYYDGGTPGGMVADTIDWFVALPSNLMDRFSELMDTRVFPQKPATSGQGASQPAPQAGQPQQLPPASAYSPGAR